MRLQFNLLWFENQIEDVRTQVEEIEEYIGEVGFKPSIHHEVDASNLSDLSRRQEQYNEFDLVVVDWDLGTLDMQGDVVAQRVRKRFGYTDILFYSGKAKADLRRMVHDRSIDGVYCMSRGELVSAVSEHIDEVVKRLSRLEAMRGLAVGVVGQCDDGLRAIIARLYERMDEGRRSAADAKLRELVESAGASALRGFQKAADFDQRLRSRSVTSYTLYRLARTLLETEPDYKENAAVLADYEEEAIQPRNALGHALEKRGVNGWEVVAGEVRITRAEFPALRLGFLRHVENIDAVCGRLGIERI